MSNFRVKDKETGETILVDAIDPSKHLHVSGSEFPAEEKPKKAAPKKEEAKEEPKAAPKKKAGRPAKKK